LLLGLPGLRWLAPAVRVRLQRADGSLADWDVTGGVAVPVPGQATGEAAARAVELPPERLLERRLMLPALAPADLAQAVRLEVASASPFGPDQTVFGYAAAPPQGGVCQVDVAITSRQQLQQLLPADAGQAASEVWALPAGADRAAPLRPVVFQGFGEGTRERAALRALAWRLGLLVLGLALLAALLLSPTLLLRHRAQQADQAFVALQRQAAPQIAQREALMQRAERLRAIGQFMEGQLALAPVMDMLTRTVPDGAWLTQLRAEGNKLVLNGNADDAAALVQLLAAQPGVRDVRLASPATRGQGASKETFVIEMNLDSGRYGPVASVGGAS
jgi:general secretion pathway protein L